MVWLHTNVLSVVYSATRYDFDKGSACSIKLPGCFCCPLILLVIISLVVRMALLINILAAYMRVHFYLSRDKILSTWMRCINVSMRTRHSKNVLVFKNITKYNVIVSL